MGQSGKRHMTQNRPPRAPLFLCQTTGFLHSFIEKSPDFMMQRDTGMEVEGVGDQFGTVAAFQTGGKVDYRDVLAGEELRHLGRDGRAVLEIHKFREDEHHER